MQHYECQRSINMITAIRLIASKMIATNTAWDIISKCMSMKVEPEFILHLLWWLALRRLIVKVLALVLFPDFANLYDPHVQAVTMCRVRWLEKAESVTVTALSAKRFYSGTVEWFSLCLNAVHCIFRYEISIKTKLILKTEITLTYLCYLFLSYLLGKSYITFISYWGTIPDNCSPEPIWRFEGTVLLSMYGLTIRGTILKCISKEMELKDIFRQILIYSVQCRKRDSLSVMNENTTLSKLWCVIPKQCH